MLIKKTRPLVLVLLTAALAQACAAMPEQVSDTVTPPAEDAGSDEFATRAGEAESGTRLPLSDDSVYADNAILAGDLYQAASGRQCRRLLNLAGESIRRSVCRESSGRWYTVRSLRTSVRQPTPVEAENLSLERSSNDSLLQTMPVDGLRTANRPVSMDSAATEHSAEQRIPLQPGETLWSFARRTTGNALNWPTIARLNGIEDTLTLKSGSELLVPQGSRINRGGPDGG